MLSCALLQILPAQSLREAGPSLLGGERELEAGVVRMPLTGVGKPKPRRFELLSRYIRQRITV